MTVPEATPITRLEKMRLYSGKIPTVGTDIVKSLVDAGDIEGARASLHAFVARYPAYTLPENLRALAR